MRRGGERRRFVFRRRRGVLFRAAVLLLASALSAVIVWHIGTSYLETIRGNNIASPQVLPVPTPNQQKGRDTASTPAPVRQSPNPSTGPSPRAGEDLYRHIDEWDRVPQRPREAFIPFDEYLNCLTRRLHLDRENKRELPLPPPVTTLAETAARAAGAAPSPEQVVPYLIQPVSFEVDDVKQFMCSLQVPVRHVMYVMNGEAPEMQVLLEGVVKELSGWTSRVSVVFEPGGVGGAGAINIGLRHALATYSVEEAPFFFVSEANVRIPAAAMSWFLPHIYDFTLDDRTTIANLAAEVAAEPAPSGGQIRRTPPSGTIVAGGNGVLSTSALLPERVRQLPLEEQLTFFNGNYSLFFWNRDGLPGLFSSFFVSRLAVLTAGYWDENYYPEFFDDPDMRWRHYQLGFRFMRVMHSLPAVKFFDDTFFNPLDGMEQDRYAQEAVVPAKVVVHRGGGGTGGGGGTARLQLRPALSDEATRYREQVRNTLGDNLSHMYAVWKWNISGATNFQKVFGGTSAYHSFNRRITSAVRSMAVDAWVLDRRRQVVIANGMRTEKLASVEETTFDEALLRIFTGA